MTASTKAIFLSYASEDAEAARRSIAWTRPDLSLTRIHDDSRWPVFLRKVGLADEQLK